MSNYISQVKAVSENYSAQPDDQYIGCLTQQRSIIITLANTSGITDGATVVIKDDGGNASNNPIIITCNNAFIDNQRYQTINVDHGALTLIKRGTGYAISTEIGFPSISIPAKVNNVLTFGATGDGQTDDSSAINAAIVNMSLSGSNEGYGLYFPPGTYRLSHPINIVRQVYMYSDGTSGLTILKPDVGVTAIVVHTANDATAGVTGQSMPSINPDGGSGSDSIIERIRINGTQASVWQASTTTSIGSYVMSITGSQYVMKCTGVSGDATTGLNQPNWSVTQAPNAVGTTISDHNVTWTYEIQTGIWARARCYLRYIDIGGISGDGLQFMADTNNSPPTNCNGASFDQVNVGIDGGYINGNAVYIKGGDTNACAFRGLNANGYKLWGVWESSFLGNLHQGHQVAAASGVGGAIGPYLADNGDACNVFISNYSEDGAGKSRFISPSFVWGGLLGDGVTSDTTATVFNQGVLSTNITMDYQQTNPVSQMLEMEIGAKNGAGILEFYDNISSSYYLQHDAAATGWWSFNYAAGSGSDAFAFSTAVATQGPAKFWTPNGIYVGKNSGVGVYVNSGSSAPGSGTYSRGDRILNNSPSELGSNGSKYTITGWICTTGGTPGTWLEMHSLTGN